MKNVALVCDWLTSFGGSERVLLALSEIFPEAPIYTLVYDQKKLPQFSNREIYTSFIQDLPLAKTKYRSYIMLMPTAVEQFDLQAYDLVISSSHAVAKGIITRPDTMHICYCHTPMRYAWDLYHLYVAKPQFGGWFTKKIMPFLMNYLRVWDRESADRVDYFIANSHNVAERIKKYYQRESTVIYPPVAVAQNKPQGLVKKDYFVVLSRLIPQKNIDIVVEAFNHLGKPLLVIGEGSSRKKLAARAKKNISFLGFQPEEKVWEHLEQAQALIFPGEDDFGMTPLEAMAVGTPVIALGRGGALESVIPGKTGEFFDEDTATSLQTAVEKFEPRKYNQETLREHAMQFDEGVFKKKIVECIEEKFTHSR